MDLFLRVWTGRRHLSSIVIAFLWSFLAPLSGFAGPIDYAGCMPSAAYVHIVADHGTAQGKDKDGAFTPSTGETVGIKDLTDAADADVTAKTPINLSVTAPAGSGLFIESGAFLDLQKYPVMTLGLTASGRSIVIAGGIRMPIGQLLTMDAGDISEIVCPTGAVTSGQCPDSNGMSAAIYVGEVLLRVTDGVGESSCPGGQLILQDVWRLTIAAAAGSTQRLCINLFSSTPNGMNIDIDASGLGKGRQAFLRLNNNNAIVRAAPADPTAELFIGGGVGLCYN